MAIEAADDFRRWMAKAQRPHTKNMRAYKEKKEMVKTPTRMMFLAIGLVTVLSTASAISLPGFQSACTANGGVLGGGPGSGTTCTFVETETVPGSHPVFVWEVDVDQEIVQTWRNASASGVEETVGEKLVTGCRNHQNKSIDDFEDNPNCQPQ